MEYIISICLGLGLAAATGFRIFVPLLVTNLASLLGLYHFTPEFGWMGSYTALAIFGTATIIEIGAYYIPWLDNALDTIALPGAILAGTIMATSVIDLNNPALKWVLGILLGGGTAGIVQAGTGLLRLGSTATTGGLANPIVSSIENIIALIFSILAIFIPMIIALLVLWLVWYIFKKKLAKQV